VLVLAGPSGVGKGTLGRALLAREPNLWFSVSATTRPPRPSERDGVDYHFLDRDAFERLRAEGGFLEAFEVYGHWRGTPRRPVLDALAAGRDVLIEVDTQGALAIRKALPEAVLVFVKPPSREEQARRLRARGTEDPAEIARRLAAAAEEERAAADFDEVVVNDDLGAAVERLAGILARHRTQERACPNADPP
jgi:guanylate kinase